MNLQWVSNPTPHTAVKQVDRNGLMQFIKVHKQYPQRIIQELLSHEDSDGTPIFSGAAIVDCKDSDYDSIWANSRSCDISHEEAETIATQFENVEDRGVSYMKEKWKSGAIIAGENFDLGDSIGSKDGGSESRTPLLFVVLRGKKTDPEETFDTSGLDSHTLARFRNGAVLYKTTTAIIIGLFEVGQRRNVDPVMLELARDLLEAEDKARKQEEKSQKRRCAII